MVIQFLLKRKEGKEMKGIIDRFEDEIVVIEMNGVTKDFPKSILPMEAEVGDIVEIVGNHVDVLKSDTNIRKKEIEKLMEDVWED